jgi:hypothetical protein
MMHLYSSILLGSLLFTGITAYSPDGGYSAEKLHQSDSVQQQLLASDSGTQSNCSGGKKSPSPGCGRRDG